jgi:hypothetical protein
LEYLGVDGKIILKWVLILTEKLLAFYERLTHGVS